MLPVALRGCLINNLKNDREPKGASTPLATESTIDWGLPLRIAVEANGSTSMIAEAE
jgi:hypothetical protein